MEKPKNSKLANFAISLIWIVVALAGLLIFNRCSKENERRHEEFYSYCERCNDEFKKIDMYEIVGHNGYVCADCCIDNYNECRNCELYFDDDDSYDSYDTYCHYCGSEYCARCENSGEHCGAIYPKELLIKVAGGYSCPECYNNKD